MSSIKKYTSGVQCTSISKLTGKIAIVTGANCGIGLEVSIQLAHKGCKVIMACRNQDRAEHAKKIILLKNPSADLEIMLLDLNSLDSVRSFAKEFINRHPHLHLLIENAGIMTPPLTLTEDGLESQMGVNYFAHFLLTKLLFPILNRSEESRIVTLSSIAHKHAKIDFTNLNSEHHYSRVKAYGQSKLACLMFAYELNRRITNSDSKVIAVASHPGVSDTDLGRHLPSLIYLLAKPFYSLFSHSPIDAAWPIIFAATASSVSGGDYYGPTGLFEMSGAPDKVKSSTRSYDEQTAKRLWELSEEIVEETFII